MAGPDLTAHDYTALFGREKKSWNFIGFTGGIPERMLMWGGLGALIGAGLGGVGALIAGAGLAGVSAVVLIAGLLGAGGMGWLVGTKAAVDHMPVASALRWWLDAHLRQPRTFRGASRDAEPDVLHWQVTMWEPADDPKWWQTYATFLTHFQRKGN